MSAPLLTLTPVAYTPGLNFDATILSGGFAGDQSLRGYQGDDFLWIKNSASYLRKRQGGLGIGVVQFNEAGGLMTYGVWDYGHFVMFQAGDEMSSPFSDHESGSSSGIYFRMAPTQINTGLRVTIPSNQSRTKVCFRWFFINGNYRITASNTEGRVPSQVLNYVAPNVFTPYWFDLETTSVDASTCVVEVRRTSVDSGGGDGAIGALLAWIETPIPRPEPSDFRALLEYSTSIGT
jgi:hypothetical protein